MCWKVLFEVALAAAAATLETSPLETASTFQKLFLTWLNPTIRLGSTRPLEEADIPPLPHCHTSKYTLERFLLSWDEEIANNPSSVPSISRAFFQPTFVEKIFEGICRQWRGFLWQPSLWSCLCIDPRSVKFHPSSRL
jgi:hypothetical protein